MIDTVIVYLAFGANLGDRHANLVAALQALPPHVTLEAVSLLYETEPAYVLDQPRFLNGVLRGRTALEPLELLAALKCIEAALGRTAGLRYGPRPVDLDILLYGNLQLDTPRLHIPHPAMFERPFVLIPLAEIAPDLVSPGQSRTITELARDIRGAGNVLLSEQWEFSDKMTR